MCNSVMDKDKKTLTDEDKRKIEACMKRPATVWDCIKSIITIEKLNSYFEMLENNGQLTDKLELIKEKWDAMSDDEKIAYRSAPIAEKIFKDAGIATFQIENEKTYFFLADNWEKTVFVTYTSLKDLKNLYLQQNDSTNEENAVSVSFVIDLWALSEDELNAKFNILRDAIGQEITLSYDHGTMNLKPDDPFVTQDDAAPAVCPLDKGIIFTYNGTRIVFAKPENPKQKTGSVSFSKAEFSGESVKLTDKNENNWKYSVDKSVSADKYKFLHRQLHFSACFTEASFDADLLVVLQKVALVSSGTDKRSFPVGAHLHNWRNNKTDNIFRETAFKLAAAIRLTIDETQKLLYTVLADEDQLNINPRLPNEMIYAYAIINELPMTGDTSLQSMLESAKKMFLKQLFGDGNISDDEIKELCEAADGVFNILDSANMTKSALLLAAIRRGTSKTLLESIKVKDDRKRKKDKKEKAAQAVKVQTEKDDSQDERCRKLFPDNSVMQECFECAASDDDTEYTRDIMVEPVFSSVQHTKQSIMNVLSYVIFTLRTARDQVDNNNDGWETRQAIYDDMRYYLEKCVELFNSFENANVSVIDFLPLLGDSNLGQYSQTEFSAMIDNIIVKKLKDEAERHINNNQSTVYHGENAAFNTDKVNDFIFIFKSLKVAFRDLRAVTLRNCPNLWSTYVDMNNILKYPFFDNAGVGMMVYKHEPDEDGNYTYTVELLKDNLKDARRMPNPETFLEKLLSDVHCYEYFNHEMLSRGKHEYISEIEGEKKLLKSCKIVPEPLFIENNGTYIQKKCDDAQTDNEAQTANEKQTDNEYLKAFYFYGRFNKQYFSRTVPFNRSDILKLCFWDFLSMKREKEYNPGSSKSDFTGIFDRLARKACCGEINERNSLDRFLLLCLSYENPGQFLKKAIMYYVYSESEKSKEFREMLK